MKITSIAILAFLSATVTAQTGSKWLSYCKSVSLDLGHSLCTKKKVTWGPRTDVPVKWKNRDGFYYCWATASQSFAFFCVALAFWNGGQRIADWEYSIFQFFAYFAEIIFGSQVAGLAFSFATDIGKAEKAARTFQTMLRKTSTIDGSEG
ncbi:hypothetical protein N0V84_011510 [Fusarium piperis]|uniref:Uncharacterized protein n=1 Tax=Fusarium piperis TaxID=1435070 RepID=A0A9W8W0M3_9HYPO|nr:hypothetical protein N0V84_011510 [Fusarium piperis]